MLYQGNSAGATAEGQAQLRAFYDAFPPGPVCGTPKGAIGPVIARFDQMSTPFQAIVWGRVLPARHVRPGQDPGLLGAMGRADQPGEAMRRPEREPEHVGGAGRVGAHRAQRRPRPPARSRAAARPRPAPPRRPADGPAMRLVSYLGDEDGGTAVLVGDRLIPVFDGFLTGIDLDPEALDDLRRRAAVLEGGGAPARLGRAGGPGPVPGQDRVRRPQLPSPRRRGWPAAADPPAAVLQVRQHGHRRRRADRVPGGHARARPRGRARRRHRHAGQTRAARGRARPRGRLPRAQRRQRPGLAGRAGGPRRGRGRRWPVAAGQGLRHLPADGLRSWSPPTRSTIPRRSGSSRGGCPVPARTTAPRS